MPLRIFEKTILFHVEKAKIYVIKKEVYVSVRQFSNSSEKVFWSLTKKAFRKFSVRTQNFELRYYPVFKVTQDALNKKKVEKSQKKLTKLVWQVSKCLKNLQKV
jgi:hypothetical protein